MGDQYCDYDIIIIGAGIAGLTAAVRSLELGLRVLVLEKGAEEIYPCNTRQSGGVIHIGFLDPYRPQADLIDIINQRSSGESDQELSNALTETGWRFLDWLKDKGTNFISFNAQEGYKWCIAPPRALRAGIDWKGRGPDVILRDLAHKVEEMGGDFKRKTRALSLLKKQGSCIGVEVDADGQNVKRSSTHVLIADGGFQSNRLLFEKYIGGNFDRVFQRGARTGMGDGLKMAEEAGAQLVGLGKFYGHLLCADAFNNDKVWPYPELDAIATAGILVDANGRRVADEGKSGVYLTNALAKTKSEGPFFVVFDEAIWAEPGCSARIPVNPLLEEAGGTVFRAQTLHELERLIGCSSNKLCETIDAYNLAVTNYNFNSLPVPRSTTIQPWKIIKPPFMAIPVCPGITYTMGGIATDRYSRVLDENNIPIPGLLAAGAATGGLEGGSRAAYIGGIMKSGVFGLIAAEQAAKQIKTSGIKNDIMPPEVSGTDSEKRIASHLFDRPHGLANFPILRGVIRYGIFGTIVCSAILFAVTVTSLWPNMGLLSLAIASLVSLVVGVIGMGFTELIRLIVQLLIPK